MEDDDIFLESEMPTLYVQLRRLHLFSSIMGNAPWPANV
jgi:hypothetical protein